MQGMEEYGFCLCAMFGMTLWGEGSVPELCSTFYSPIDIQGMEGYGGE